jgi:hypothetical protein
MTPLDPRYPLIFEGDNPEKLDEIYLGCSLVRPRWETIIMAPPKIDKMGHMIQTDHSKLSMQTSADWGYILKIGTRSFEEMINLKPTIPDPLPFNVGELVFFDEYHHQARRINGILMYFISDTRHICSMEEPEMFDIHLLVCDKLLEYRERAKKWREMHRDERKSYAPLEEF